MDSNFNETQATGQYLSTMDEHLNCEKRFSKYHQRQVQYTLLYFSLCLISLVFSKGDLSNWLLSITSLCGFGLLSLSVFSSLFVLPQIDLQRYSHQKRGKILEDALGPKIGSRLFSKFDQIEPRRYAVSIYSRLSPVAIIGIPATLSFIKLLSRVSPDLVIPTAITLSAGLIVLSGFIVMKIKRTYAGSRT